MTQYDISSENLQDAIIRGGASNLPTGVPVGILATSVAKAQEDYYKLSDDQKKLVRVKLSNSLKRALIRGASLTVAVAILLSTAGCGKKNSKESSSYETYTVEQLGNIDEEYKQRIADYLGIDPSEVNDTTRFAITTFNLTEDNGDLLEFFVGVDTINVTGDVTSKDINNALKNISGRKITTINIYDDSKITNLNFLDNAPYIESITLDNTTGLSKHDLNKLKKIDSLKEVYFVNINVSDKLISDLEEKGISVNIDDLSKANDAEEENDKSKDSKQETNIDESVIPYEDQVMLAKYFDVKVKDLTLEMIEDETCITVNAATSPYINQIGHYFTNARTVSVGQGASVEDLKSVLNPNIVNLYIDYGFEINDLSFLPSMCPNLERITLDYCNALVDLSFIYNLPSLETVYFTQSPVVSRDLVNYLESRGIEHNITEEDLQNAEKLQAILDEIITEDMTDEEKEHAIYQRVIADLDYHITKAMAGNEDPLGSYFNGYGVCATYAYVSTCLLNMAGVHAYEITSNIHAWTMTEEDGKYYYSDPTNMTRYPFGQTIFRLTDHALDYHQDPYSNAFNVMKDPDSKAVSLSDEMLEQIAQGEEFKSFVEKNFSHPEFLLEMFSSVKFYLIAAVVLFLLSTGKKVVFDGDGIGEAFGDTISDIVELPGNIIGMIR